MAIKTQTIKVNRDRHGPTLRGGINGRVFTIPTGSNYEAEEVLVEHLRNSGVSFEEVSDGAGSKEGSGDPAPNYDTFPAMAPRSLDDSGGTQPGDVTTANSDPGPSENVLSIEERAALSDIRVAAERRTKADDPVAAQAGEGEGGTPKVEANPFDHDNNGRSGGAPKGGNRRRRK